MVGGGANKAKVLTADVHCAETGGLSIYGTALMGKLLIASIDFVSSRGCTKIDN